MFLKTFQYRVQPTKAKEYLALRRRADAAYERLGHSLPAYLHSSSDPHRWLEIYTYASEQEYRDCVAQLRQDLEIRRLWPRFQALLDPRFPAQVHEYHHAGDAPPAWVATAAASAPVMTPPPAEPAASRPEEPLEPPAGSPAEREPEREDEDITEANDADADTFSADDLPAADDDLEPEPPQDLAYAPPERPEAESSFSLSDATPSPAELPESPLSEAAAEPSEAEAEWPVELGPSAGEGETPLLLSDERVEQAHDADAETYTADDLPLAADAEQSEVEPHPEVSLYDEPATPAADSAELNVYEPPTDGPEQLQPEPAPEADEAPRHGEPSATESAPPQEPSHPEAPVASEDRNGHAPQFNYYFDDPMSVLEDANPQDYSPAPPADSVPLLDELPSEDTPPHDFATPAAEGSVESDPASDSPSLIEEESLAGKPDSERNFPEFEGFPAAESTTDEGTRPLLPMVLPEDQQPLAEQPEESYLNGAHYALEDHAEQQTAADADEHHESEFHASEQPLDRDSDQSEADDASSDYDHDLRLEPYDKPNGRHDYGQQYPPR